MEQAEINRRVALSIDMHDRNFNCAQSVACACCDLVGLDEAAAFRMLEGFGGGMGDHTETCGALSGAVAIIGYAMSEGPHNPTTKFATYEQVKPLVARFREEEGATTCGVLTGLAGGPKLQPCPKLIQDCVRFTIDALEGIAQAE